MAYTYFWFSYDALLCGAPALAWVRKKQAGPRHSLNWFEGDREFS